MIDTYKTPELPEVFRGSEARKAGLITKGQLRGPSVRRLFQDVYARADVTVTHELRCRGAALLAPPEAVLTGRSAATVLGVELAKPNDPVEFVVPEEHRFGPIDGLHIRRTEVAEKESHDWHGIRIAKPARVALDLLLRLSPRKHGWVRRLRIGVPDLDAFLRAGLVPRLLLFPMFLGKHNRGIRLARQALKLSDPRAESHPESELRVVLQAGGFAPTPQFKVRRKRVFLGRLDLALVEDQVAIEYDGRWHSEPDEIIHDIARRRRIADAGWEFVIVDADQLATDYAGILERIREAQKRQAARRAASHAGTGTAIDAA